jgi:hypothetical protein
MAKVPDLSFGSSLTLEADLRRLRLVDCARCPVLRTICTRNALECGTAANLAVVAPGARNGRALSLAWVLCIHRAAPSDKNGGFATTRTGSFQFHLKGGCKGRLNGPRIWSQSCRQSSFFFCGAGAWSESTPTNSFSFPFLPLLPQLPDRRATPQQMISLCLWFHLPLTFLSAATDSKLCGKSVYASFF